MYEIKASYKGLVEMMHDRFYNIEDTEKPAKKKKKGLDLEEIKLKLHMDKKGVFVPADNIRMMLIGNQHRKGAAKILGSYIEKGKGTQYEEMCKSSIFVISTEPKNKQNCYIKPKRKTFDTYDERSFINSQGSRGITRRPIINLPWSVDFIIQVTDDSIHESKVRELFDVAGLRCGCCAYGPKFGRCVIEKWELVK